MSILLGLVLSKNKNLVSFSSLFDNICKESNDDNTHEESKNDNDVKTVSFYLPFKNQSLAVLAKKQLRSLSSSISIDIQLVFCSKPIQQILRPKEKKPDLVNNQSVVFHFKCDQRDSDYLSFSTRHLHQYLQEN